MRLVQFQNRNSENRGIQDDRRGARRDRGREREQGEKGERERRKRGREEDKRKKEYKNEQVVTGAVRTHTFRVTLYGCNSWQPKTITILTSHITDH